MLGFSRLGALGRRLSALALPAQRLPRSATPRPASEPTPDNSAMIEQVAAKDPAQQPSLTPTLEMASMTALPVRTPTRTPALTTAPATLAAPTTPTTTTEPSVASPGALPPQSCDMTAGTSEATFLNVALQALGAGSAGFSVSLVSGSAGTAEASFVLAGAGDTYARVNVTSVPLLADVWAQLNAAIWGAAAAMGRNVTVQVTDDVSNSNDSTGGLVVIPAP